MIEYKDIIKKSKIIVVLRRLYGDKLLKTAEALIKGGIKCLEITFDQSDQNCIDNTSEALLQLKENFEKNILIGAGTVLNEEQLNAAESSHAKYIVSPNTNLHIIELTKQKNLLSIPGALTPSEIMSAWDKGADFIKIFPANIGLDYIKAITLPLSHVDFIANGGITCDNAKKHLENGFSALGISAFLSDPILIESNNYQELTNRAKKILDIVNN